MWVTITGGTIRNNQAIRGGGIFNSGRTDLQGVTLSANQQYGWWLASSMTRGPRRTPPATTFSSNVANHNGGGLYNATGGQVDMTVCPRPR